MADGLYLYCIVDTAETAKLGSIGLFGNPAYIINHEEIGAVISPIPYQETNASIDNILAHQRVIEAARKVGTTLPVKFGTIFRKEEGVRTLLSKSHGEYRSKLDKLKGMDEFGVKVMYNKAGIAKMRDQVERATPEVVKMRKSIAKSSSGKSYFTKMKMNEAIRSETYRKIDELSREIHKELVKSSMENSILKTEHEQIILNAAYLVPRGRGDAFLTRAADLGRRYAEKGLIVHSSGPWAPYSFC